MSSPDHLPALPVLLEGFLRHWLPDEKGAARNTRAAYATALRLLLEFCASRHQCNPAQITLEQVDSPCVQDFLSSLERERANSARSRNARLAAIKSFLNYVEPRRPDALSQILAVRAIPTKRYDTPLMAYAELPEQKALLEAIPDSRLGVRDRAMILLCIDLGLRESEMLSLTLDDLHLASPAQVAIMGKGRRAALMPLSERSHVALQHWLLVRGKVATDKVFLNDHHQPLGPRGFQRIVQKHVANAAAKQPSLRTKNITPHSLRHSCAMNTLAANGHDIRKVALWLRHASTQTTEIYVRADPANKLELPSGGREPPLRRGVFEPSDRVRALLEGASRTVGLCEVGVPALD